MELRLDEEGEIISRGPDCCVGYTDPELTARAFDEDGWYRTGDVGVLDDDGYLTITDRLSDVIIRGGENISAQEVEAAIYTHPEVSEVSVFGIADDRLGEVPAAVIYSEQGSVGKEELTAFLGEAGVRVRYLHSDVDTLRRVELLTELRQGVYDVLIGINLLREGLDLPEVSLVAILDADKEGFLRGKTALLQTIGRAARNVNGTVLMYADKLTEAIQGALEETNRRRAAQLAYNEEQGITPESIVKGVSDIAELLALESPTVPGRRRRGKQEVSGMSREELEKLVVTLEEEMYVAAEELRFEYAAKLRDEIKELRRELNALAEAV